MNKTKYIHEPSKERLWFMEVIVAAYSLSVKENIISAILFFFLEVHINFHAETVNAFIK